MFFLAFIAPIVILPLFNKFIPLEEGELRSAIEQYAQSEDFKLKGIFKMDASRRSTKSNAFFTGFGKYRRIALFDTLIKKHTIEQLVSVLSHEIGHYKRKHIFKQLCLSVLTNGIMFFILSFFIKNQGLFAAFKMDNLSIYASLFFFAFLYTPINMLFSILSNFISRRHEYEADRYVIKSYGKPEAFIEALKKLTVDNLSNLTPHPIKVFFDYSHPPVLQRILTINDQAKNLMPQEA
jgi:STE24 endopeptidase